MNIQVKNLPRGQEEIRVELTPQEYEPFLKRAAFFISEKMEIRGFRKGKAPYEIIRLEAGDARVWEEALELAVKKTLFQVLREKNIAAIGSPKIDVEKLAPENPVVYKATVSVLPKIDLADCERLSVERKSVSVSEEEIEKTLKTLQKMRAKEILVKRALRNGDKAVIHFTQSVDSVVIEGGEQKNFPLIVGDNTFLPDFEKNLLGMKSGEKKEFGITYPKNYHKKNLAEKTIDFTVEMKDVFEIQLPELHDEFARSVGRFKDLKDLRDKVKQNLLAQTQQKEEQRLEEELILKLIEKSRFGDIPDVLLTSETKKMLSELEQGITAQGLKFEDYLGHLKKSRADLLLDFVKPAIERIKGALITREFAKKENIYASQAEIDQEVERLLQDHSYDKKGEDTIKSPEYREYVQNVLTSHKVMEFLKKKVVR